MNSRNKVQKLFVGVDVSKAKLDVYRPDTNEADTAHQRTIEILHSVKGVGSVMISTIIAELPELGKLNRGEVAKLVGIAPINRDSGTKSGKRFIGGGRGQVRRVLYMATVVAIRHNQTDQEWQNKASV